jgi:histone deacetylase HOS3
MDQLTSGLKRITLRMPTKEEHDAREKQKALEAEKKAAATTTAAKTASRKTPAARTKTTKAATTTTKKTTGRPAKASKPTSPVEIPPVQPLQIQPPVLESNISTKPRQTPIPLPGNVRQLVNGIEPSVPAPEPPKVERAASHPLQQPQPIQAQQTLNILPNIEPERRTSTEAIEPPTELKEMAITPEDLPKSSFTTVVDPLPLTTSPPRPDTPPPPPPASAFMNYTAETFGTAPVANMVPAPPKPEPQTQVPLQWMPTNSDGRPMTPASKRQDLPVFTANGAIPFAPNPNPAGNAPAPFNHQSAGAAPPKIKLENESADIWDVPETPAR